MLFASVTAMAQSDKYEAAMKKGFAAMDSAKTVMDWQNAAAMFERIGDAEKTQWLPYYYAGLAHSTIGWMDPKGDADANADKIKALCDKAEAIEKNAELYSLRNMAATQQMMVDPQSRYMSYGQQAADYLQKAMQLNPNNPRAAYLQAMSVYGTPEQYGGGKEVAKPLVQKAVDLGKAEQVKPLYPNWSLEQSEKVLATYQSKN